MGLDVRVDGPVTLERLRWPIVMIDGALVAPGAAVPDGWRELRLRTPAGMVTIARDAGGVRVVVFGNADAGLVAMQKQVAEALTR